MNYEQKYKEALERMKSWVKGEHPECFSEAQKAAEFIFPELKKKESKDERIMRELCKAIWTYIPYEKAQEYIAWLEKQGENKPTEYIEIKFCEGDKVVSNQDGKVYTVGTVYYVTGDGEDICLHDTDGNHLWTNRDDLNNDYHLWSINDAKDGDVLVHNKCPFIFMGIKDGIVQALEKNLLEGTNPVNFGKPKIDNDYQPATKEQRDLLFRQMKEEGYEWDSEKKELKKIEPKKINANKVIEWLKITINERAENYGVYKATRLILPYNSIEDFINDFKEDFGL